MSAGKGVVFALQWCGKRPYSVQFSVGGKPLSAARKYLMPIGLMPNVPYNPVVRRVKNVVNSHRKFHYSKAGSKVSGVYGDLFYNVFPQFFAHLRQLFNAQFAQVGRAIYLA